MMAEVFATYPNLELVATTLRVARTATRNDWGGACYADGQLTVATPRVDLEILDRIGGGDSFASGLIYGILAGLPLRESLEYGVAHGALAMTTPGDISMASLAEVQALVAGRAAGRPVITMQEDIDMIERHITFNVLPDKGDDFERFFAGPYAPAMADAPGFVRVELLRELEARARYQMVLRWEDAEAAAGWRTSPVHQALQPELTSLFSTNEIVGYDVITEGAAPR